MRATHSRGAVRWVAGWLAALALVAVAPAQAQEDGGKKDEHHHWTRQTKPDPETANRPQMSEKTRERYDKAYERIFEQRYDDAKQELDKLYFKRMNPVEQAKVHLAYAYIASGQEDRDEARRRFQAAIDVPEGLLPEEAAEARFKIASLYMQDENWKAASDTLEQWFKEAKDPNSQSYYLLALTYYQQERFDEALVPALEALEKSDAPQESWLQLPLAIYLTQQKYKESIPFLQELVARFPSKGYFLSLSTVYGSLGDYDEAAIPLQLAYEGDYLDEEENLKRLGQLLLYLNVPYRAGEVLSEGIEHEAIQPDSETLAMLANSWIAAREYDDAIEPMQRAASLAEDGELFVRLAQVYVQRENWDGATAALNQALSKGDLRDPGSAHLLMGIAFYSQKKPSEARRWFESATRFDAARDEANIWIAHIDEEQAQQQAMTASGG